MICLYLGIVDAFSVLNSKITFQPGLKAASQGKFQLHVFSTSETDGLDDEERNAKEDEQFLTCIVHLPPPRLSTTYSRLSFGSMPLGVPVIQYFTAINAGPGPAYFQIPYQSNLSSSSTNRAEIEAKPRHGCCPSNEKQIFKVKFSISYNTFQLTFKCFFSLNGYSKNFVY